MQIEILKSEDFATPTGKPYKRLMLEVEGKQYPYKNVTAWSDSAPDYDKLRAGYTLQAHIDEKDSDAINPNSGKPYKNRTLYPLRNDNGTEAPSQGLAAQVADHERRIAKLEQNIEPF